MEFLNLSVRRLILAGEGGVTIETETKRFMDARAFSSGTSKHPNNMTRFINGLNKMAPSRWVKAQTTRELFWVASGQLLAMAGGFLSIRVLTSALGAKEYGILALIQSLAYFPPLLLYGPLAQSSTRFYIIAKEKNKLWEFILALIILMSASTLIVVFITFGIIPVARPLLDSVFRYQWFWFLLGASLMAIIDGYSMNLDGVQNAARQRIVVSWHQNLSRWGRLGLAIVFFAFFGTNALYALFGFIVASVIVALSQSIFLLRLDGVDHTWRPKLDTVTVRELTNRIVLYAFPFVTWGVFAWLQFASDRWTLQFYWNATEVGVYAALFQIGYIPLVTLGNMVLQLVAPIVYEKIGDNKEPSRRNLGNRLLLQAISVLSFVTAATVIISWLGHDYIFRILTPPSFWSLSALLPLVVLAAGLFSIGQLLSIFSQAFFQSHRLIGPKIGFAILHISLNVVLGKFYGSPGVVYALLSSSGFYTLWMSFLSANQLRTYNRKTGSSYTMNKSMV